ncbi:GGDEF domain-containing protein [Nocardioides sp. Bht2]|uniref:GGDEF domain-containing protein n=1 Tax=Nocardioides sp. Bht2 TaxID=3392297 RepID=UPI0039B61B31
MLDAFTLRVAFGVISVSVLALTYFVTYRSTRSAYSGWWCLALICLGPGGLLYLFNDTGFQAVANPLGNAVTALGAVCIWAAVRALDGRELPWQVFAATTALVLVPAFFDDPAHDVWPAGSVYLASIAVVTLMAMRELVRLAVALRRDPEARLEYSRSVESVAAVCGLFATYYLLRTVVFVTVGPDDQTFRIFFGAQATCMLLILLVMVVSFNVSILSFEHESHALRERARRDPLTGLLNRKAFEEAVALLRRRHNLGEQAAIVVADLDEFKEVNDGLGHQAGDRALVTFAEIARTVVGDHGVVARLGGDEFLLFTYGASAEELVGEIDERYAGLPGPGPLPSVSFGISRLEDDDELAEATRRADVALYRAKGSGGDQIVRAESVGDES